MILKTLRCYLIELLLLFALLLSDKVIGQDTVIIAARVFIDLDIFETADGSSKKIGKIQEHKPVIIVGKYTDKYNRFVKVVSDSLVGFVWPGYLRSLEYDYVTDESLSDITNTNFEWKINKAKKFFELLRQKQDEEKKIEALYEQRKVSREKAFGIGIRDFDYAQDHNIYDISFTIYNKSPKTVKYVWLSLTAINPVGDLVANKRITAVGPVISNNFGEYNFESVFYSPIIDEIRIFKIEVQFTDGTKKTIIGKALLDLLK